MSMKTYLQKLLGDLGVIRVSNGSSSVLTKAITGGADFSWTAVSPLSGYGKIFLPVKAGLYVISVNGHTLVQINPKEDASTTMFNKTMFFPVRKGDSINIVATTTAGSDGTAELRIYPTNKLTL
jgi:hypothetical protein